MTRSEVIHTIRTNLRRRSGKSWSVTGGRGTGYGWLRISSPPKRRTPEGYMTESDQTELAALLGLSGVHFQGEQVMASTDAYIEYIERSEGKTPTKIAQRYWD